MKKKNLISLTIGFTFLAMSITGILMYLKLKNHEVEIIHTLVGLLFTGFAVFHILNNWSSITGYSTERTNGKIKKELVVAGLIAGAVVIGGLTEVLEPVAEAGKLLKGGGKEGRPRPIMFDDVKTNEASNGTSLSVIVQKSRQAHEANIAVWVEDSTHNFVENLMANSASLPAHKTKAGTAKPNYDNEAPHDSFILSTKTTAKTPYFVMIEIEKGGKNELYEATITGNGAAVFQSKNHEFVERGIVQY